MRPASQIQNGMKRKPRDEIGQQQRAREFRQVQRKARKEEEHRADGAAAGRSDKIDQDHTPQRAVPEQEFQRRPDRGMGLELDLRLRQHARGQRHGRHQQDDREQRHGQDLLGQCETARIFEDRRQHQHADHADDQRGLRPAIDVRTLVIIGRQFRAPGQMRDRDHRPADIHREQPDAEIQRAHRPARHEHHPDANDQQGRAEDEERPAAAPGRAPAIADISHQRIDEDIGDAAQAEYQPGHGEADAHFLRGVELRQIHDDGQAERRQRQAREDIGKDLKRCDLALAARA